MNKGQLVETVAKKSGRTKKEVAQVLDGIMLAVQDSLASGEKVSLMGLGTFEVRRRPARTCKNPRTKQIFEIPEATVPAFRAGQLLKAAVAKK